MSTASLWLQTRSSAITTIPTIRSAAFSLRWWTQVEARSFLPCKRAPARAWGTLWLAGPPVSTKRPPNRENFPKKNRGLTFPTWGKTPDLLRSRRRVPVRETFTEGSGTTVFPKPEDTATARQEEESRAQVIASRVK